MEEELRAIEFLKNVCTDECVNKEFVVKPILNLIEKLKEENKKLNNMYRKEYNEHMEMKRQNGVLRNNERILREENKTLTDEYMIQKHLINADFLKDYIPISVIQNKKRELEKKKEYLWDEYDESVVEVMCRYSSAIKVLDELLEERR